MHQVEAMLQRCFGELLNESSEIEEENEVIYSNIVMFD